MVNKLISEGGYLSTLSEKRQFPLPEIIIVNFDDDNVIMTSGNDENDENVQWNW